MNTVRWGLSRSEPIWTPSYLGKRNHVNKIQQEKVNRRPSLPSDSPTSHGHQFKFRSIELRLMAYTTRRQHTYRHDDSRRLPAEQQRPDQLSGECLRIVQHSMIFGAAEKLSKCRASLNSPSLCHGWFAEMTQQIPKTKTTLNRLMFFTSVPSYFICSIGSQQRWKMIHKQVVKHFNFP